MNYAEIAIGTGKFLDDHNGSVSAAATAVIALLTLMLVIVTNRQARLTRASIDLARQEFAATHRPRVFVQSILLHRGAGQEGTDYFDLTIVNGGESDAFIRTFIASPYRKPKESVFLPQLHWPEPHRLPANAILSPGERLVIRADQHGSNLGSFEYEEGTRIFATGLISYRGNDGIERVTGFCREYFPAQGMWHPVPESEYEHSY
ncbi:MAG: hypothetical protein WBQ45_16140 [Roseiarcus sp.]